VGGGIDRFPGSDVQQLVRVLLEQFPDVRPVLGFLGTVVEVHAAGPLVDVRNRRSVTPVTRNGQR
jgi:hypothetical protein